MFRKSNKTYYFFVIHGVMQTGPLNNGLIKAIREKMPENTNIANMLMETLSLNKESVYRRLRGDVPFTFGEAVTLASRFGISLDKVAGTQFIGSAIFSLDLVDRDKPFETFYKILSSYLKMFLEVKDDPTVVHGTSSNVIPQTTYLDYEYISRFRMFKWLYQQNKLAPGSQFGDLKIPVKLRKLQTEYIDVVQSMASTFFIWDGKLFESLINDIKYFANIHLIEPEGIEKLKAEIFQLIDDQEEIAKRGRFANGKPVQIFVSEISFDATYSYTKAYNYHASLIRVFSINSFTTYDDEVFEAISGWIQSLKKFSILISESNEMQRILFFKRQRELAKGL